MYYDPTNVLTELGIKRPAGVDAAQETYLKVSRLANAEPREVHPSTATPETIENDIARAVHDRATRAYAQEYAEHFRRHAAGQVAALYRAEAGRILADLAKASVKPLKAITTAAEHIGPEDTGSTVIERDEAAVEAWRNRAELEAAAEALTSIHSMSALFAELSTGIPHDFAPVLWWTDVEDHNHLERIKAGQWLADCPGDGWLALAHAGHTLKLATPAEAMQRSAAVRQAEHDEATAWQRNAKAEEETANRAYAERQAHLQALLR